MRSISQKMLTFPPLPYIIRRIVEATFKGSLAQILHAKARSRLLTLRTIGGFFPNAAIPPCSRVQLLARVLVLCQMSMLRNQTQAHSQWLSSAARPVYHSGACLHWDAARGMANCAKQRRRVADYVLKFGCEALTFGKLLGRLWHKVQFGPLRVGILERFLDTCWPSSSPNFSPLQNFWKLIFKPATVISFREEVRVSFLEYYMAF